MKFCLALVFILKIGKYVFLGHSHFLFGCFEDFAPNEPEAVCSESAMG